ncbi:MAG: WYL domain-containing protein [Gemmatimonadota bacterium]
MKGDPTKTQRLLDLLAFLATRRAPVEVGAILRNVAGYGGDGGGMDELPGDAVLRKFERDKAELRDLGIPLDSETVTVWGGVEEVRYRLRADSFFLPVLRLLEARAEDADLNGIGGAPRARAPVGRQLQVHPSELAAAVEALHYVHDLPAFPLRRAARSALAKLTFDLAPEALDPSPGVLHLSSIDRVVVGEALSLASEAMARRKSLHFEYFSIGRDHRSRRSAHPLGLLYQGSRWYLVGQDPQSHEIRMFRVDRMEEVEVEERRPRTPDFEVPEGFSLEAYRGRRPWELDAEEEVTVTVHFRPPLSLLAARNDWGMLCHGDEDPPGEREGRNGASRVFHVRNVNPFLRWILTHHGMAEIVSPASLRQDLEELRKRTLEVHQ